VVGENLESKRELVEQDKVLLDLLNEEVVELFLVLQESKDIL